MTFIAIFNYSKFHKFIFQSVPEYSRVFISSGLNPGFLKKMSMMMLTPNNQHHIFFLMFFERLLYSSRCSRNDSNYFRLNPFHILAISIWKFLFLHPVLYGIRFVEIVRIFPLHESNPEWVCAIHDRSFRISGNYVINSFRLCVSNERTNNFHVFSHVLT